MPTALKKMHDRENGFTLVELLIVVLIIGILAAVAIPVYLGIQQQGYKAAVRSDVNLSVKRVQVALTEGNAMETIKSNQLGFTQKSVKGEVVQIVTSPSANAGASDFGLQGIVTTTSTPTAGPINYGYFYDSVTGKFTESDDSVALGSSAPNILITTGSLPSATVGSAYSATVNSTTVNPAGATQYTATGLPTGWGINQNTGVISAPASAVTTPGNLSVTVTATNGAVNSAKAYTLAVNAAPIITTTTLPGATTDANYSQQIVATGNPTPTFTVTSGALPTGMNLTTGGLISGTPSVTGTASFTVTATNAGGSTAQAYTLTVTAKPVISTGALNAAGAYLAYNQPIAATGTPAPTFSATGLPSTLSINSSTGAITGTPTTGGTYNNVQVTATNTTSSDTKTYTLNVAAGNAAPTGTPSIYTLTTAGGNTTSYFNYMWSNTLNCATGTAQYRYVDETPGYNRTGGWVTWTNFEIFSPTPVGVTNTWHSETRCATGAMGAETAASPVVSTTSQTWVAYAANASNLLTNGSFEGNTNGWGGYTGNPVTPNSLSGFQVGHDGNYSLIATTNAANSSIAQDVSRSVAGGQSFTGGVWIKKNGSGTGTVQMVVWNGGTGQPVLSKQTTVYSDKWTYVSERGTAPSNSTFLRFEVYFQDANTSYTMDQASLYQN